MTNNFQIDETAYISENALLKGNVTAAKNAVVLDGAKVLGDVTLGEDANVWFNAVVRADNGSVKIGRGTNIQDCAVVHESNGTKTVIGDYVTVGHNAILHGCAIGNHSLVGMGATILDNAVIGECCLIGAGALVTEGSVIPDGSLVVGMPGKVRRELTEEEKANLAQTAAQYIEEAKIYRE